VSLSVRPEEIPGYAPEVSKVREKTGRRSGAIGHVFNEPRREQTEDQLAELYNPFGE
jgi:hypothetical protein